MFFYDTYADIDILVHSNIFVGSTRCKICPPLLSFQTNTLCSAFIWNESNRCHNEKLP